MFTRIRRALALWHLRRAADFSDVEVIFAARATADALGHSKVVANEF